MSENPETIYILNITQGEFFRYTKKNITDLGYNSILRELLSKSAINILKNEDVEDLSRWDPADKIIFVPKHLFKHVEKNYGEIISIY
jgi:hypothetical protein